MNIITTLITLFLIVNTILAIFTVFKEKRAISTTWAWLLVLILLPGIGFIIYFFLGRKISKDQIFDLKTQKIIGIEMNKEEDKTRLRQHEFGLSEENDSPDILEMINLFMDYSNAPLSEKNEVQVYVDGYDKFGQLLEDIENAKDHIHIMYYIFRNDKLGKTIIDTLAKKAGEGVKVSLLFDSLGSRGVRRKDFDSLIKNGGQVGRSFERDFILMDLNINFRNHRKIVVIDGKIGYTGGFNVGDDYLGEYEHMGYWRDTHLRIEGEAVLLLQARFIMDWNASQRDKENLIVIKERYFPEPEEKGDVLMQVVSSGPDTETQIIKKGFIKMINMANESIMIQTPYLIPDEAMMEAFHIALASGIDVKIMIPNKPDHLFIYDATLYYAQELAELGAEIYIYDKGFLHAKTIMVDSTVSSVGTANFDIRSFKLNFEINTFIYDTEITKDLEAIYKKDIEDSFLLTRERSKQFTEWERFKQAFSRLLSPLL